MCPSTPMPPGQVAAPMIVNGAQVITPAAFPGRMLHAGQSALEDVRLVVSPTGKPERCDIIAEVRGPAIGGDSEIGTYTCALMMRLARFRPATGSDRQPTYGTYSTWISWRVGDGLSYKQPQQVDGEISVDALPAAVTGPALVAIDIMVAADGVPGPCVAAAEPERPALGHVKSPALAAVACRQFTSGGSLRAVHASSGEAVASVQRYVARFSTAGAGGTAGSTPK